MSEETYDIESLLEANATLQTEVTTLRTSNRLLRKVNSALRGSNESLRRQIELANFNDETFKKFCAGEFDAPGQFGDAVVVSAEEGGLPESGGQAEQSSS